jgi:hypothetical protein
MNATIATCTTTLLAKAEALVASGGLAATNRPGVYRATSSDGTGSYVCTAQGVCCCEAARRGNACKHVLAAQIAVADAQRERAAARGVVVLRGEPGELLAPDVELDLYGPAEHCGLDECDCEDYAGEGE